MGIKCRFCGLDGLRWHQSQSGQWFLVHATGEQHTQGECDRIRIEKGLPPIPRDVAGIDPLGWSAR